MNYIIKKTEGEIPQKDRNSYPFSQLEVGYNLFIPGRDKKTYNRVSAAISSYMKNHPSIELIRRTTNDPDGITIYRTK